MHMHACAHSIPSLRHADPLPVAVAAITPVLVEKKYASQRICLAAGESLVDDGSPVAVYKGTHTAAAAYECMNVPELWQFCCGKDPLI